MSILSRLPDQMGYFYGFHHDDPRQVNVRQELDGWVYYVGGDRIGVRETKDEAEDAAIVWIRAHPQEDEDE